MTATFETASTSTFSQRRRCSTWSKQFCTRQSFRQGMEDDRLPVSPSESEVHIFLRAGEGVLSPPCFNWKPLELFLNSTSSSLRDLTDRRRSPSLSRLCLIDDRSFQSHESENTPGRHDTSVSKSRELNGVKNRVVHRLGDASFRKALDERELYDRLLENVSKYELGAATLLRFAFQKSKTRADRRVL